MHLLCAQQSDVIFTRQKNDPKTVYFFKKLVVHELALFLIEVTSFVEVFDRYYQRFNDVTINLISKYF